MNDPFSKIDAKTRDLEEAVKDAKCTLEEMNEAGDLEDRLEAAQAVEDAQYNLSRHLLTDYQDDPPESPFL